MKRILFCIFFAGFAFIGCQNWLDINKDPNNAMVDEVTIGLYLPQSQTRIAALLNNSSNQYFLSHHLTKSGGVGGGFPFLHGLIQAQNSNDWWSEIYRINTNLSIIVDLARDLDCKAYEGIAQILLVHNYNRLVDMFGDVPYTQALGGRELNQPAYDKAQDIYASLLLELDLAIANLTASSTPAQQQLITTYELAKFDVMCKGDINKWIRFANSLKLRMLMRVSGVQNVNAQIAAIADRCLAADEIMFCNPGYLKEANKMSPFYSSFGYSQTNSETTNHRYYRPSRDFVDMLRLNNDPRLRVYVQPRLTIGPDPDKRADYEKWGVADEYYVGIPFGQQDPPLDPRTSSIGLGILGLSGSMNTGPLSNAAIMAGFEVQFFLAEAALNGIISGGDETAQAYYEAGVRAVFKYLDVPLHDNYAFVGYPATYPGIKPPISGTADEAAKAYLLQDNDFCNWNLMTTTGKKMAAIASQKWISLFGINPIEAWCEFRRLDLPEMGRSVQAMTNYNISILLYPQTEFNLNKEVLSVDPDRSPATSLLFWDKENKPVPMAPDYL